MLDLICRRYPGTKPSSYLDIEDPYVAIQVDYAIAKKHLLDDYKYDREKMDGLQSMLKPLGIALGIEYGKEAKTDETKEEPIMDIDDALAVYGSGNGVVVQNG